MGGGEERKLPFRSYDFFSSKLLMRTWKISNTGDFSEILLNILDMFLLNITMTCI